MSILVIAEHDNASLKAATLNTVAAASKIGSDVDLLIVGSGIEGAVAEASKVSGVRSVITVDGAVFEHQLGEDVAAAIVANSEGYTHILAPATTSGKNAMPRVAALLDVAQISDIISVESADTFKRPIYAGNIIATVKSSDRVKVITVRTTAFDSVSTEGSADTKAGVVVDSAGVSAFVGEELAVSDRPELTAASVVISGGRGMQNGDNFAMLEAVADKLGAAVGASRAAVDAGFVPNDMQVGQTGKIVAPDLYIAVGISGAIQHLAGMKDSKIIAAINKDEEAPIFQVADYGLVADLFDAIPELEKSL